MQVTAPRESYSGPQARLFPHEGPTTAKSQRRGKDVRDGEQEHQVGQQNEEDEKNEQRVA